MNGLAVVTVAIVLACFGFAGWQDIKTRAVSNKVWLVLAVAGAPLALTNYFLEGALVVYFVNALIAVVLGFVMFFLFGRFFGGADAKALMVLGLTVPVEVPLVLVSAFPFVLVYCVVAGLRNKNLKSGFGLNVPVPYVACLFASLVILEVMFLPLGKI